MTALIPRVQGPQVQAQAMPGVRNTARVDMSPLVDTAQSLNRSIQGVIAQEQERIDTARMMEARTELSQWYTQAKDPRNEKGLSAYKGENAFGAIDKLMPDLDSTSSRIRQRLGRRQQQQFDLIAGEFRQEVQSDFQNYASKQSEAAVQAKAAAMQDALINEATLAGLDGDLTRQQLTIGEMQAAGQRMDELNGLPAEVRQQNAMGVASAVYRQTTLGMLSRNPDDAADYFNQIDEHLTAADRIAVEDVIYPVIRENAGYQAARAAIAGGHIAGAPSMAEPGQPMDAPAVQSEYEALGSKHGFTTTSTTRSKAENDRAGGVTNSQHLDGRGTARDWSVKGKTPEQVRTFVADLRASGFKVIDKPHGTGPHIHAELPRVRRGGGSTAYAAPAATQAEALERLRSSPLARDERALRTATRTVKEHFAELAAEQETQDQARGNALFQRLSQLPPGAPLARGLQPDDIAFLARNSAVRTAVDNYREITSTGRLVKDDPITLDAIRRMQAEDPDQFHRLQLAAYSDKLSGSTFLALTKDQQSANEPEKQVQWATEGEVISLAADDLGLSPEKRGEFRAQFFREKRAFIEQHKREPTADEMQAISNRLKLPFVKSSFLGFGGGTRRVYQGPEQGYGIPAAERTEIVQALAKQGNNNPSEQQILQTYLTAAGSDL